MIFLSSLPTTPSTPANLLCSIRDRLPTVRSAVRLLHAKDANGEQEAPSAHRRLNWLFDELLLFLICGPCSSSNAAPNASAIRRPLGHRWFKASAPKPTLAFPDADQKLESNRPLPETTPTDRPHCIAHQTQSIRMVPVPGLDRDSSSVVCPPGTRPYEATPPGMLLATRTRPFERDFPP